MNGIWTLVVYLEVVCFTVFGSTEDPSSSTLFLVSAPEVVHAGTLTSLAVSVFADSPGRLTAEVAHGNTRVAKTQEFQEGFTSILTLPFVPDSIPQDSLLNLTVRGYRGESLVFSNTTSVRFSLRNVSSFIQTSRLRYQPGDTVRIRVVSVQLDNRPYEGRVAISAQDPGGTVVDRWEATGSQGIVVRQFVLSQTASVGQWTITATLNGVTEEKAFAVGQNERPPFEVLVRTPSRVTAGEGLSATVRALYPSGQPVHGTINVSVALDAALSATSSPVLLRQIEEFYGSVQVSFNEDELQTLTTSAVSSRGRVLLYITACVADGSTGQKVNKTVEVQQMQNTFLLKFHNYPPTLKPSLHFSVNLSVSRYDHRPLSSSDMMHPVVIEVSQNGSAFDSESTTQTFPVPEDGNVHLRFRLQDQIVVLYVRARFQTSEETLTVHTSSSPSGSYIQISPVNTLPALIGFPFQLEVESTFQLTRLHFVVSSRGQVVAAGTGDSSSSSFSLTPALSWSPTVRVTVYCVLSDGEVATDAVDVAIDHRKPLSLTWSSARAQPGERVSLTLTGLDPGSQVGVLAMGLRDDSPLSALDFEEAPECDLKMLTNTRLYKKNQPDGCKYEERRLMVQEYWSRWMEAAEPFLWLDTDVSGETWTSEDITVPDGVLSLGAAALVMSGDLGLRFTPVPPKLTVSKDFSLLLDVPAHLIRGEEIVLEVNVINHLEQDTEVIVLIAQSDNFEFVLAKRGNLSVTTAQKLTLGSHTSASALFPIRPVKLGEIEISVDAASADASESLSRRITVKPEGVERFSSQTLFLELEPRMDVSTTPVSFSFPPDVVPGSQRAHVALVGNILALSIHNMDSLVQMPVGCGEQNMIHFAPCAFVLHYLNMSTDDEAIRSAALSHMALSYHKQLSYQRDDGSFSAFGSSDSSGSTWLTAFVLRCFLYAKSSMHIEQAVLDGAMTWLLNQQGPEGAFSEAGRVIHTELQGGLDADPVALTAYVLVALLEDGSFVCTGKSKGEVEHTAAVTLAQKYLEGKVSSGGVSNYSLCLAAYALALAGSPAADGAIAELNSRADDRDGVKTWSTSSSRGHPAHSAQIEMTSYMLLALLSRGDFVEGIALMKWLTTQLSPFGGYGTTQDTVVALQALVCYAVYSGADTISLDLIISAPAFSFVSLFKINASNYRVYQSQEITPTNDIDLNIYMRGKGFAVFQLNVFYNLDTPAVTQSLHRATDEEAFLLDIIQASGSDHNHIMLSICISLRDTAAIPATGMVIVEVGVLSGFALSPEAAVATGVVRKVETTPDKVILYLDSLTKSQVCIQLTMVRKFKVAKTKDAVVQVYDYYEPTRRAAAAYNSPVLNSTDACFFCGANCEDCWPGFTIAVASLQSRCFAGITNTLGCLFLALTVLFTAV